MNLPDFQTEERPAEIRQEAAEIPDDLPRTELRRRLIFGADNLVVDPRAVAAAWLAPLSSPSLGVGEA